MHKDRPTERERGGACVPCLPGSSRARTAKANSVAAAAAVWKQDRVESRDGKDRRERYLKPLGSRCIYYGLIEGSVGFGSLIIMGQPKSRRNRRRAGGGGKQTAIDQCEAIWQVSSRLLSLRDASLPSLLPPFQIIRHSKNVVESNHLKFDKIYIIR
jgi:hypothetical protein